MKTEMFKFLLEDISGYDIHSPMMKAPSGQIVYDRPSLFRYNRNPGGSYLRTPQNPGGIGFVPVVLTYATAGVYFVSLPFMMGTALYPQVSSKTYQSAMTGQPTVSDSRLLFGGKQGLSYFKF